MLINIQEIPEGRSVIDQQVTMTESQITDGHFIGKVVCHAKVDKAHFQVRLQVQYKCVVKQECSRCLKEYDSPIKGSFELLVGREIGKNISNNEDDYFDYTFNDFDKIIDIRQSIYEEVMVNLPIKPLCYDNCPGIITSKSNGQTTVMIENEQKIDPRWEVLKQLKNKNK